MKEKKRLQLYSLVNLDDLPERKPSVTIGRKCITLHTERGYAYEIGLDRIDTPMRLLNWVHHLQGKQWMDREDTRELVEKVCNHFRW